MSGQQPPRRIDPFEIPRGAMGADIARYVRILVRHLDGTAVTDPNRLAVICRNLDTTAAVVLKAEDGLRRGPLMETLAAAGGASSSRAHRTVW